MPSVTANTISVGIRPVKRGKYRAAGPAADIGGQAIAGQAGQRETAKQVEREGGKAGADQSPFRQARNPDEGDAGDKFVEDRPERRIGREEFQRAVRRDLVIAERRDESEMPDMGQGELEGVEGPPGLGKHDQHRDGAEYHAARDSRGEPGNPFVGIDARRHAVPQGLGIGMIDDKAAEDEEQVHGNIAVHEQPGLSASNIVVEHHDDRRDPAHAVEDIEPLARRASLIHGGHCHAKSPLFPRALGECAEADNF